MCVSLSDRARLLYGLVVANFNHLQLIRDRGSHQQAQSHGVGAERYVVGAVSSSRSKSFAARPDESDMDLSYSFSMRSLDDNKDRGLNRTSSFLQPVRERQA